MDWNWTAFIAMFLLFISADRVAGGEETPMAYEVLQQFDFPIGHLPTGATGYELNNLTGDSKAYLGEGTRSFSVEGIQDQRAFILRLLGASIFSTSDTTTINLGLLENLRVIESIKNYEPSPPYKTTWASFLEEKHLAFVGISRHGSCGALAILGSLFAAINLLHPFSPRVFTTRNAKLMNAPVTILYWR